MVIQWDARGKSTGLQPSYRGGIVGFLMRYWDGLSNRLDQGKKSDDVAGNKRDAFVGSEEGR